MEKLMDYSSNPFKAGDVVECISDECPAFYELGDWTKDARIKSGDRLTVRECSRATISEWQFAVSFEGKKFIHSARLFKLVDFETAASSDRLESALKFLETSGDVLQALKIAAGVR